MNKAGERLAVEEVETEPIPQSWFDRNEGDREKEQKYYALIDNAAAVLELEPLLPYRHLFEPKIMEDASVQEPEITWRQLLLLPRLSLRYKRRLIEKANKERELAGLNQREDAVGNLNPYRVNKLQPLFPMIDVLTYPVQSMDNPFYSEAQEALSQHGLSISDVIIHKVKQSIPTIDKNFIQEELEMMLGEDYPLVAGAAFDLRAVLAEKKRRGMSLSIIELSTKTTYHEAKLVYTLLRLSTYLLRVRREEIGENPNKRIKLMREVEEQVKKIDFDSIPDIREIRLAQFFGHDIYRSIVHGRLGNQTRAL